MVLSGLSISPAPVSACEGWLSVRAWEGQQVGFKCQLCPRPMGAKGEQPLCAFGSPHFKCSETPFPSLYLLLPAGSWVCFPFVLFPTVKVVLPAAV